MKHILYNVLGVIVLSGLCISCEDFRFGDAFLEKPLTTDVNIDTIFNHRKYAEQMLNEAYHSLPDFLSEPEKFGWLTLEILTDLGDTQDNPSMYAGQASPSNPGNFYYNLTDIGNGNVKVSGPISGIRQCWIYIENVDRVPDMTAEEKAKRKAEAKMIIAYHYSDMFRNYGGVPRIDHAYGPDEDFTFNRMTVEETVDFICSLCDEAAADLPWSVSSGDEGRMTAAGALALKSRVLTFAASPLFNSAQPYLDGEAAQKHLTWYGNEDRNRWQAALDAGLAFLEENENNGNYWQLVDTGNPREDYLAGYYGRHSGEAMIVSHRYNRLDMNWYDALQLIIWGRAARPTAYYGDMFEWKTGEPFDWNNPEHAANPFWDEAGNMNRDPRMYETLWVNGDKFRGGDVHFADLVQDGVIDENDKTVIGDPNPDIFGNFSTGLHYKNWSLDAFFSYSLGGDIYNYQRAMLEGGNSYYNQTTAMNSAWSYEGHVTSMPRVTYDDPMGNSRFSDRWIEDGSYFRLKTLSLSYDIPINSSFLQGITVWGAANNLYTCTKYLGSDPELSMSGSPLYQGIDSLLLCSPGGAYPYCGPSIAHWSPGAEAVFP